MSYNPFDLVVQAPNNSSTAILTASSTFTGTADLLDKYPSVGVHVETDQNGTLYVDFSSDGTNWDETISFVFDTTRSNPAHTLSGKGRYCRVRFTNTSASDQTYFRLHTAYGQFDQPTSAVNSTLPESHDASVVRPTDYHHEVAMNKREGRRAIQIWGHNDDIDTASAEVVADYGGPIGIMTSADTLNVVSTSTDDDAGGSGCTMIAIEGIDENHLYQLEYVTMDGTTPVTTANQWLGVNRAYSVAGDGAGDITISDTAATVGDQAKIGAGQNVSHAVVFHTQINHSLLIDDIRVNALKISGGGGSPRVTLQGKSYSRVTGATYLVAEFEIDTSVSNYADLPMLNPLKLDGREVFYLEASTDVNNTRVIARVNGVEERNS